MPETEVIKANTGVEPTAVQEARVASLQRFNWYFVYTPLIVLLLVILILTGLLMWGVLSPNIVGTREFASGVADIVIILAALPMTLIGLLPPLGLVGFMLYQRQKKGAGAKYGRLHRLFWRIDSILDIVQTKAEKTVDKAGQPVIRLNALMAYIITLFHHIVSLFRR
jgi:hypothetical protein